MDFKTIVLIFSFAIFVDASLLKHHFVVKSAEDVKDTDGNDTSKDDEWWRTAIFYQIYPRSFMDSNGDGTGDLPGIISRLEHLSDMGVTAAWLSPIYPSPGIDQGYDISDYRDVDKIFGTLDDLKSLIAKAHDLGIKIILDFVPNHTSENHNWFEQSVKSTKPYTDYYIWTGNASDPETKKNPPNNWVSVFAGSAWTYNDVRKQWYLHQFTSAQPDLNYYNENVVKDMKAVLKYWLDLNVDGFRMDAVPFLFEDPDLKDEPVSGTISNASQYEYLKHIYTTNQDKTYDMIYQFRQVLDEYNNKTNGNYSRIMMTEAYTNTAEQLVLYYGDGTKQGAHFSFNFNFITELSLNLTADKIITTTNKWLSHLDNKKYVSNWVLGNHDQHRVASRLGAENVDALNMLTAFLPGIQVTYMGEEIGMEDGNVTFDQHQDPQATDPTTFEEKSRDFERTPFQWDSSDYAGFTNNSTKKTWLPVSDKYKKCNLAAQNVTGIKSHYNVYKQLVNFRKNFKNISSDAVSLIKLSENVLQIVRKTDKGEYVYLFNTGDSSEAVKIYSDSVDFEVAVISVSSQRSVGANVTNPVTLQGHESLILKIAEAKSGSNQLVSTWLFSLLSIAFLVLFY